MKFSNVALPILYIGVLLGIGARLAWGLVVAEGQVALNCPGAICTLDLGPGHWIILTPAGQTIDSQETDNETRYRIETPRQVGKQKP